MDENLKRLRLSSHSHTLRAPLPPHHIHAVPHLTRHGIVVQVEIYVEVDEMEPVGASASTRATISATATTDTASAMNTLVR